MRRRIVVATMWLLTATLARGAEFVVTTSSDGGPGSLRQAILDANTASGSDTITFGIEPLGGHTIQPSSPLPAIIDAVVIDGTTQPGFAGTPLIEIDGSLAGVPANGLTLLDHDGSTIRSLAINRFQKDEAGSGGRGILIDGGSQHSIVANFLGTDPSGTVDLGNGRYGVALEGCERTTIGGTDVADRNLLSGNDDAGVLIRQGNSNVVWGNYIGTDVSGTSALAGDLGVFILTGVGSPTTNNHVGGALAGQGNVIVANGTGITIGNSPTTGTVVQGNLIGTNAAGTVTLGTMETGVHINSAPDSTIGGTEPNAGNVIGGASDAAVIIRNAAADDNVVQGNIIGTDASGTIPLPNGMGVLVSFAASGSPVGATIGGSGGAGNVITNSSGAGVVVLTGLSTNPGVITSPTGVRVQENVIVANGGLGIDLEQDGITANDADDLDEGANGLQNAPVLGSATAAGGMTTIEGTLDAAPNATFTLEFFANAVGDPSGAGEGETFLGVVTVNTDALGDAVFSENLPGEVPGGMVVTATATDAAGNTSEFAANVTVVGPTTTSSSTTTSTSSTDTTSSSTSVSSSTATSTTAVSTSITSSTIGPTSSTATTATTLATTTTSTTIPADVSLLTGARLLLTDNATKPQRRRIKVLSKDRDGLALGEAAAVLSLLGTEGSLRVVAGGGDGFDAMYVLDATSWRLLRRKKPEKGLRYRNGDGPIRAVVLKSGKRMVVKGKGQALAHSLAQEPDVVWVELRLGGRRYCMEFGGNGRFKPGKKLLRKKAPVATGCPPSASPSGAVVPGP